MFDDEVDTEAAGVTNMRKNRLHQLIEKLCDLLPSNQESCYFLQRIVRVKAYDSLKERRLRKADNKEKILTDSILKQNGKKEVIDLDGSQDVKPLNAAANPQQSIMINTGGPANGAHVALRKNSEDNAEGTQ